MSEIAIEFKNVSKSYPQYHHITSGLKNLVLNAPQAIKELSSKQFSALENISFTINKGETVGIIGRNGAGKSTTLGLMAGVLKPNQGQVVVNGRISPLLELGGGFHPDLSGIENIQLNGVLLGLSRKRVKEKMQSIIEFSELGQFIHNPVRTYSTGMVSRLGFSVVAHLDPEILLIDEVLAVGDISFQNKCRKKIKEFKEAGVTIVLVSHGSSDVREICDRAIWIDQHQIKMDGASQDIMQAYEQYFNS